MCKTRIRLPPTSTQPPPPQETKFPERDSRRSLSWFLTVSPYLLPSLLYGNVLPPAHFSQPSFETPFNFPCILRLTCTDPAVCVCTVQYNNHVWLLSTWGLAGLNWDMLQVCHIHWIRKTWCGKKEYKVSHLHVHGDMIVLWIYWVK